MKQTDTKTIELPTLQNCQKLSKLTSLTFTLHTTGELSTALYALKSLNTLIIKSPAFIQDTNGSWVSPLVHNPGLFDFPTGISKLTALEHFKTDTRNAALSPTFLHALFSLPSISSVTIFKSTLLNLKPNELYRMIAQSPSLASVKLVDLAGLDWWTCTNIYWNWGLVDWWIGGSGLVGPQ